MISDESKFGKWGISNRKAYKQLITVENFFYNSFFFAKIHEVEKKEKKDGGNRLNVTRKIKSADI